MVGLEVLEALDGIQWLGSGEETSKRFAISQPTISRHCKKALTTFGLSLQRQNGEWDIIGDQTFLRMERKIHQLARRSGYRQLRLEATYWSAPTLCTTIPPNWMLGRSNIVGIKRNFQLLQERIVDCWIAGLPDVPTSAQPDLVHIPLTRLPVFFTCAPEHPLLQRQRLDYSDIAKFPTLALPSGSYPLVEEALKRIGLWNDGVRMTRYRRDKWEGKSEEELVVGYGTSLSMKASGGALCRLPLFLPFDSGDVLITQRDFLAHPALSELHNRILSRARAIAQEHPEMTVSAERSLLAY
ncbi:MAG: LysR substrate-binding domain-containing protein [Cyanobium sp.]